MIQYIALLRGINVGGNKMIKMEDLKKIFEEMGYKNPRTLLASGNVVFESDQKDKKIKNTIEMYLFKTLKFEVKVLVRSITHIQKLIKQNPFKNFKQDADVRLYVTFLPEKPTNRTKIKEAGFEVIDITDTEVFWYIRLTKEGKTVEGMAMIEKQLGKYATTRNWNTVQKIASAFLSHSFKPANHSMSLLF